MKQNSVVTPYSVASAIINYDSSRVVVCMKMNEQNSLVQMYSLANYQVLFEEYFTGTCIKMLEVE